MAYIFLIIGHRGFGGTVTCGKSSALNVMVGVTFDLPPLLIMAYISLTITRGRFGYEDNF